MTYDPSSSVVSSQKGFATWSALGRGERAVFVFLFIQTVSECHQSYQFTDELRHEFVLSMWRKFCNFDKTVNLDHKSQPNKLRSCTV